MRRIIQRATEIYKKYYVSSTLCHLSLSLLRVSFDPVPIALQHDALLYFDLKFHVRAVLGLRIRRRSLRVSFWEDLEEDSRGLTFFVS